MSNCLSRSVSNILNPFLVGFTVIAILAFESTNGIEDALKWLAISLALSVLPVFLFTLYMIKIKKLDGLFTNPRQQRTGIYILATLLGCAGTIILFFTGAPRLLIATFIAGLVAIIFFMAINLFWKISLHTGFIAAGVAIVIMVYGGFYSFIVLLVPVVGWARLNMGLHSWLQVAGGALLAAGIVVIIYSAFGIMSDPIS